LSYGFLRARGHKWLLRVGNVTATGFGHVWDVCGGFGRWGQSGFATNETFSKTLARTDRAGLKKNFSGIVRELKRANEN